jgi:hypothetical protein
MDSNAKIEFVQEICIKLADLLMDPTQGKEMSADQRNKIREQTHSELLLAINLLASIGICNEDFFDIINIAGKLNVNLKTI